MKNKKNQPSEIRSAIVIGLYVLLYFVFTLEGQSQDRSQDYVVLSNGDTIYEQIKKVEHSLYGSRLVLKDQIIEEYEFQIARKSNGQLYSTEILENEIVEIIIEGKISLYRFDDTFVLQKGNERTSITLTEKITLPDGKVQYERDRNWKGKLSFFVSDCLPKEDLPLKKTNPSEELLTEVVLNYNNCSGETQKYYRENTPSKVLSLGVSSGLAYSWIKTLNESSKFQHMADAYQDQSFIGGLSFEAMFPYQSDRIILSAELLYYQMRYSGQKLFDYGITINYRTTFQHHSLAIPLSMKILLNDSKSPVYTQIGLSQHFHLNSSSVLETEYPGRDRDSSVKEAFPIRSNQSAIWGGFGTKIQVGGITADVGIRYWQMIELNEFGGDKFSLRNKIASFQLTLFRNQNSK
jgi:hypothetical protein